MASTGPHERSSFLVQIDGAQDQSFDRVELPAAQVDEVTYRSGSDPSHEARKQPGLVSYGRLRLHRALTSSTMLWSWWAQARDGQPVDRNVAVLLLDNNREPVWVWRFRDAFPAAYVLTPLDASSSGYVVETAELAFDSMDAEAL